MAAKIPLASISTARQFPRWSELREVVQFKKPKIDRTARRLHGALTIADLRKAATRTTPRSVFDYVDGAAEQEITAARNLPPSGAWCSGPRPCARWPTPMRASTCWGDASPSR